MGNDSMELLMFLMNWLNIIIMISIRLGKNQDGTSAASVLFF